MNGDVNIRIKFCWIVEEFWVFVNVLFFSKSEVENSVVMNEILNYSFFFIGG